MTLVMWPLFWFVHFCHFSTFNCLFSCPCSCPLFMPKSVFLSLIVSASLSVYVSLKHETCSNVYECCKKFCANKLSWIFLVSNMKSFLKNKETGVEKYLNLKRGYHYFLCKNESIESTDVELDPS